MTRHSLGVWQGTAMVLGGVLGPGMLVLPHLAAEVAGPGAVLAWAGLIVVSVPVAITFALLGLRHPGGGGVAQFAGIALGRWAYAANAAGLRTTGRVQVLLVCLLLAVLGAAIVAGLPQVRAAEFSPLLPHG